MHVEIKLNHHEFHVSQMLGILDSRLAFFSYVNKVKVRVKKGSVLSRGLGACNDSSHYTSKFEVQFSASDSESSSGVEPELNNRMKHKRMGKRQPKRISRLGHASEDEDMRFMNQPGNNTTTCFDGWAPGCRV